MESSKHLVPGADRDSSKPGGNPSSLTDYNCRELIEGLPAAIYTCDLEGRITFFNEAAVALWGRRPEIGKDHWFDLWNFFRTDGSPLSLHQCPMAITLKEGCPVKGEEIVVERPDGLRINVLPHTKPVFDADGNIAGAMNVLADISETKAREQAVHNSEKKYRLLSRSLEKRIAERTTNLKLSEERYHRMIEEVEDYAIILLDKEGFILNWNKGAEKIKGYTEDEILGKNFRNFYLEEDRARQLPEQLIGEAIQNGKAMHEGWRVRKNGTKFWGSIVITALHDEEHSIIGFSKVTRDLTERKLAEDQLKAYTKELELRNGQLEEFAHIASHDLQEPIRKIKTFAHLLIQHMEDKAAVDKNIGKIVSSAERMETLIKGVLNYSQLSQDENLFVATDLANVIENVKEDLELLIDQAGAKIFYSTLPVVKAVPIQMQQLFSNLIGNSIKFSDEAPIIEISSEKLPDGEKEKYPTLNRDHHFVKITFKDNGIGFDAGDADQVFKLFQRLHHNKIGTGIGLALCKKIVENHKGDISVYSEVDKGTTFTIILPAF